VKKLLELFSRPWERLWAQLAALQKAVEQPAPSGCQLKGYLVGITPRSRDPLGKIVRGELHVSMNEDEGRDYARKTRQPYRSVEAIPVWRKVWTDADRTPWRGRAQA
jgi:hypothetical protein